MEPWFVYPVSIAIQKFLEVKHEGSPADFYQSYKTFKPTTSYSSISRYFWMLAQIGLIRIRRSVKGQGRIPKTMYELVPERIDDPAWPHPQKVLYFGK